jgi:hypothetical protein
MVSNGPSTPIHNENVNAVFGNSQLEVSADGSNLHPLPRRPQAGPEESEGFGSWTPDGRYFVYQSFSRRGVACIWATRDAGGLFWKFNERPIELYEGPQVLFAPHSSAEGKRVFFGGSRNGANWFGTTLGPASLSLTSAESSLATLNSPEADNGRPTTSRPVSRCG